jgi:hypothetical protein
MPRIACLRILRFQIVVHQKLEPELKGKPFVILGSRQRVALCSSEAEKYDIKIGMRLTQARANCAELLYREYDHSVYLIAQRELVSSLVAYSPRVSVLKDERSFPNICAFLLDAEGLKHMGGESCFARGVLRFVSKQGFTEGNIGIADSAFAASVAAQGKQRWHAVPTGADHQFLFQLPISFLPVGVELKEMFGCLGIKSMGQLTALPADEIAERFGTDGIKAYELSCGLSYGVYGQPTLPAVEKGFQCALSPGHPVESLTDAVFMMKLMIERLTGQLKQEGLCVEEITAAFYCDDQLLDERPVKLIRPSNENKFLLEVLRLSLENKKLSREFTGLSLTISRTVAESWTQLELTSGAASFADSNTPAIFSEAFLLLLQKMTARFGEGAIVYPVANDQYIPELAGVWQPAESKESNPECELQVEFLSDFLGNGTAGDEHFELTAGLVLKRHSVPEPVLVEFEDACPKAMTYRGNWYRICKFTNPECLSGLWWEAPVRKSYYVALLQSAACKEFLLAMLVYDHQRSGWFVEGLYD